MARDGDNDDHDDDDDSDTLSGTEYYTSSSSSRSVSDYVGNVHGGKYQFNSVAPGLTVVGREFAESLYSSSESYPSVCNSEDREEMKNDEPLPEWAQRMGLPSSSSLLMQLETLTITKGSDVPVQVTVTNQERTWEKFYVKIISPSYSSSSSLQRNSNACDTDNTNSDSLQQNRNASSSESRLVDADRNNTDNNIGHGGPFIATPSTGYLAPRGGANNACDASKPYSDSVTISIRCCCCCCCCLDNNCNHDNNMVAKDQKSEGGEGNSWYLVIGTEEEKWYYRLQVIA